MAIQIPSTPNPQTRAISTPRPTRSVHMEMVETVRVKRVSPAARSACGRVNAAGQMTIPKAPCIQMIFLA